MAELLNDMAGQVIVDLAMARNRLRRAGFRIAVPIVLGAMSNKDRAGLPDLLDQGSSLHATAKSSTLRIPVNVPPFSSV